MLFQPGKPRSPSVLSIALAAAGLMLTVAGCSHVSPLGPDPAATMPPRHLGSPIILQAMRGQPVTPAGGCPASSVALSGPDGPTGQCYRKLGTPVTITSAAVSSFQPRNPKDPQASPPAGSGLLITLPAAGRAGLTAVTTKAYDSHGYLDISVAGKTWAILEALGPLTDGQLTLDLPSRNLALQLQHTLVPPS